ncbi:hypothetical protein SAMN05661093_10653 [Kibdelosporangium aridum]|uniref:Uncharacterized protein n=1 Tax=Kibdelosporangium aridum TaxID=2030 RepID=A0A1Y5Y8Z8_KIBAR|nr:hypothetical protein SAMN05661093_10653 [Kibdelosporangium aridum]
MTFSALAPIGGYTVLAVWLTDDPSSDPAPGVGAETPNAKTVVRGHQLLSMVARWARRSSASVVPRWV